MVEAEEVLEKERKKLDAAIHLCTLFEFPDLIKESERMIAEMESSCKLMYKVIAMQHGLRLLASVKTYSSSLEIDLFSDYHTLWIALCFKMKTLFKRLSTRASKRQC